MRSLGNPLGGGFGGLSGCAGGACGIFTLAIRLGWDGDLGPMPLGRRCGAPRLGEEVGVLRPMGLWARLVIQLLSSVSRIDNLARAAQQRWWELVGKAAVAALSVAELEYLTVRLYELRSRHARRDRRGLFWWEHYWFRRRLPSAPTRVLVGGAGSGREVRALVRAGYVVDAFDPCLGAVGLCAAEVGAGGVVLRGDYDALCGAVLSRQSNSPLESLASQRYGAILLGWGSLSHVLRPESRARLLRACHSLCPEGPILASFWSHEVSEGLPEGERPDFQKTAEPMEEGEFHGSLVFRPWCGVAIYLHRRHVMELGLEVGRPVAWERHSNVFPHATFLPPSRQPSDALGGID